MKTIPEFLDDRRREGARRAWRARVGNGLRLVFVILAILVHSLILGAALLKTAQIVSEDRASAYCEGDICAGPSW